MPNGYFCISLQLFIPAQLIYVPVSLVRENLRELREILNTKSEPEYPRYESSSDGEPSAVLCWSLIDKSLVVKTWPKVE